ncbi:hypothetical protein B0T22DRAFT_194075 [Podospora appendiculata]|uniref:Uncharacterized protein n=1 Tax=Podospora appendiculata TaxID=314037 RepID=A0AAE1CE88_9PEZI|nr:hypothetical protein B0T22DRAFT_194075 [Podospora appendiculata]
MSCSMPSSVLKHPTQLDQHQATISARMEFDDDSLELILHFVASASGITTLLLLVVLPVPYLFPNGYFATKSFDDGSESHPHDKTPTPKSSNHVLSPITCTSIATKMASTALARHYTAMKSILLSLLATITGLYQDTRQHLAKHTTRANSPSPRLQHGLFDGLGAISHVICVVVCREDHPLGFETRLFITFRRQLLQYSRPSAIHDAHRHAGSSGRTMSMGSSTTRVFGISPRRRTDRIRVPEFDLDARLCQVLPTNRPLERIGLLGG